MRILVAEDEHDLNEIIVKKLVEEGYSVDACYDGAEAIDILSYTEYDAILLDIMMPKADGFQVLTALRSSRKETPVLFLSAHGKSTNILTVGDLMLDSGTKSVTRGGRSIELSTKEYALLEYLMLNQGIVLSREKIENHIWNFDYEGGTNVVDVYISYLRKKIDEGQEMRLIHTVRGRGYVLREESA